MNYLCQYQSVNYSILKFEFLCYKIIIAECGKLVARGSNMNFEDSIDLQENNIYESHYNKPTSPIDWYCGH